MLKLQRIPVLCAILWAAALIAVSAQQPPAGANEAPWWAYSFLTPPKPGEAAMDCEPKPIACAVPRPAPQVDETPMSLPGAPKQYSPKQASEWYGPADWYPDLHPPMPAIVAKGNEANGVRACILCHHPLGKGRPENAPLAGLPSAYFMQAIDDFRTGKRNSFDPRKPNTKEMIGIAKAITDEEAKAAADYYAAVTFTTRGPVVETDEVPAFFQRSLMYFPEPGDRKVPLGMRLIEMPENQHQAEYLRHPNAVWISYAPKGSIAKGEAIAKSCTVCHGPDLAGRGNVPGIAGRTPSYMIRQMYDMQQGTRQTMLMKAVVARMTVEDMVSVAAYLASIGAPAK